jgi:hypothetical protein
MCGLASMYPAAGDLEPTTGVGMGALVLNSQPGLPKKFGEIRMLSPFRQLAEIGYGTILGRQN